MISLLTKKTFIKISLTGQTYGGNKMISNIQRLSDLLHLPV